MKTTGIVLILLVATLALPLGNSFAVPVSAPPTNLTAQAVSNTQINLSWTAPVNATQNEVNGYLIEQDVNCDGTFAVLTSNNTSTSYSNTGLSAGICYAYRVSALNSAGTSATSNVDFDITHAVPSVPTGLAVTAATKSLKLSWSAPDNNGASISGYQIQRNGTILVSNTGNNKTAYIDLGLKPSTTQTYRIAAWNNVGLGPFSANVTAKTLSQNGTSVDRGNIGQAISDFVHKRNELFKQQREETLKIIRECNSKAMNATNTQRKQILEDCRQMMHALQEKYKEARRQFNEEFKTFRSDTKESLKEQKANIEKDDAKEIKRDIKTFEKDTKKEANNLKHDIQDAKKDAKKELKQAKKENKKNHDD